MNEKNNWVEQLKKIPDWTKGAIGLIITLAGFSIAFRNDRYLYSVILGLLLLLGLLYAFTYIAFSRSPSPFGGRGAFRFERYRRWAIAGNVILIILAFSILNSRVGRTYLTLAFRSSPTPEFGPLSALEPGIYISQIFEDPESGSPEKKLSVWLSANGNYYVDSIRVISTHCSVLTSGGESGAQPPDADYAFTYPFCSEKTYALNPALYLDSADQREVYFTLELAPEVHSGIWIGDVHAIIYYHTSDGRKGSLILLSVS